MKKLKIKNKNKLNVKKERKEWQISSLNLHSNKLHHFYSLQ